MDPKLRKYFTSKVDDNKNTHFCNSCEYQTTIQKDMSFHIRKHMRNTYRFVCDHFNCDQVFKTSAALEEHRSNHLCGFGIPGMEAIGICRQETIQEYYQMIVDNNQFKYVCKWTDCQFAIKHVDKIQKHVHQSHVCPYSRKSDAKSGRNSRRSD